MAVAQAQPARRLDRPPSIVILASGLRTPRTGGASASGRRSGWTAPERALRRRPLAGPTGCGACRADAVGAAVPERVGRPHVAARPASGARAAGGRRRCVAGADRHGWIAGKAVPAAVLLCDVLTHGPRLFSPFQPGALFCAVQVVRLAFAHRRLPRRCLPMRAEPARLASSVAPDVAERNRALPQYNTALGSRLRPVCYCRRMVCGRFGQPAARTETRVLQKRIKGEIPGFTEGIL